MLLLAQSSAPQDADNGDHAEDAAADRDDHVDEGAQAGTTVVATASCARATAADVAVALVVGAARVARASIE